MAEPSGGDVGPQVTAEQRQREDDSTGASTGAGGGMTDDEFEIQEDSGGEGSDGESGFRDPTEAQQVAEDRAGRGGGVGGGGGAVDGGELGLGGELGFGGDDNINGGGNGMTMGIDVEPSPAIFTSAGCRRIFVVEQIIKASGVHRPTFQFFGYIVELPLGRGGGTEGEREEEERGGGEGGGPMEARVLECDLMLTLRYEPPSPKFRSKCPGFTSYRLKVSRGLEFLYSMRGLQKQMWVDSGSRVAVWGKLELAFGSPAEMYHFLATLRHVDVTEQSLLDGRELDALIKLTTELAQVRGQFDPEEEEDEGEYCYGGDDGGEETRRRTGEEASEGYYYGRDDDLPRRPSTTTTTTSGLLACLTALEGNCPGASYVTVAVVAGAVGFAAGLLLTARSGIQSR